MIPILSLGSNPAPDVLRLLPDGTLTCVDGTAPQARLRELYNIVVQPGESEIRVCIIRREGLQRLSEDSFLLRNMAS